MRLSALLAAFVLVAACSAQGHLRERKAYWEQALTANVPPGTSEEAFSHWLSAQGFTPRQEKHQPHIISAKVEELPDSGSFVCRYWSILVQVFFDDAGNSVRNHVETLGTCL